MRVGKFLMNLFIAMATLTEIGYSVYEFFGITLKAKRNYKPYMLAPTYAECTDPTNPMKNTTYALLAEDYLNESLDSGTLDLTIVSEECHTFTQGQWAQQCLTDDKKRDQYNIEDTRVELYNSIDQKVVCFIFLLFIMSFNIINIINEYCCKYCTILTFHGNSQELYLKCLALDFIVSPFYCPISGIPYSDDCIGNLGILKQVGLQSIDAILAFGIIQAFLVPILALVVFKQCRGNCIVLWASVVAIAICIAYDFAILIAGLVQSPEWIKGIVATKMSLEFIVAFIYKYYCKKVDVNVGEESSKRSQQPSRDNIF